MPDGQNTHDIADFMEAIQREVTSAATTPHRPDNAIDRQALPAILTEPPA
jgi:hypothetical protein